MNTAQQHLLEMKHLLEIEHDAERKEYEEKSLLSNTAQKIRQGRCWFPLNIGRSGYNAMNQFTADFFRPAQSAEQEEDTATEFEYGRPVIFITAEKDGANPRLLPVNGTVWIVDGDRMSVVLDGESALGLLRGQANIGVQLYFDETTHKAMMAATARVAEAKDGRLARLRDIAYGTAEPEFGKCRPMEFPWLNPSQQQAVNMAVVAKDVAIMHGPPGTGKTTTMIEAIGEVLNREAQVMVCAGSNMAVDWISQQLVERGVSVLRIGNPTRVTDGMLQCTYERRFEAHPLYSDLWGARAAIRNLQGQMKHGGSRNALRGKIAALRDRATSLEISIKADLFDQSRVVACTLIGADNKQLEGQTFDTLFIDEAAQALEPACWVAISKAKRVILAGDHCQLPPTIKSEQAAAQGLRLTLMERLAKTQPQCVTLLDIQYRMHPSIVKFPSEWFYGGRLKSAPCVVSRNFLDYDMPLVWLDTSELETHERLNSDNGGRSNKAEAAAAITYLAAYARTLGIDKIRQERADFGLISPYRNQVALLRSMAHNNSTLRALKKELTINTIDGFQGQERDVVMISMVRSNPCGDIGFLNELRRMNVAITRSRQKLIVVGCADTLTRHKFYKKLYNHFLTDGKVIRLAKERADGSAAGEMPVGQGGES